MTQPYPGTQWPDNYQGCTIIGQWLGLDGKARVGSVSFNASPLGILDRGAGIIIVPIGLTVPLDSTGSIPANFVIPATDDPDINPVGWTYQVTENFTGGRKYNIKAPRNTVVNLVNVAPVAAANGTPIYRGADGNPGILVLSATEPVPLGTPPGMIIARTAD